MLKKILKWLIYHGTQTRERERFLRKFEKESPKMIGYRMRKLVESPKMIRYPDRKLVVPDFKREYLLAHIEHFGEYRKAESQANPLERDIIREKAVYRGLK